MQIGSVKATSEAQQQLDKQDKRPPPGLEGFELEVEGPSLVVSRIRELKSLKRTWQHADGIEKVPEASIEDKNIKERSSPQMSSWVQPELASEVEQRIMQSREASTSGRSGLHSIFSNYDCCLACYIIRLFQ